MTLFKKVVREGFKPSCNAGGMKLREVRGAQDHKLVMAENPTGTHTQALSISALIFFLIEV